MPLLQSNSGLCSLRCHPAEQPVSWPEINVSTWSGTYHHRVTGLELMYGEGLVLKHNGQKNQV